METVTITIGEALRFVKSKSERVTELLAERGKSAWGYEGETSHVRKFDEISDELHNAVEDRLRLKNAVMEQNLLRVITAFDHNYNLHEANLKIDYLLKEIKSLKQIALDPNAPNVRERYGFNRRTTEDLVVAPLFEVDVMRTTIEDLENQVRILDSARNKANWETSFTIELNSV